MKELNFKKEISIKNKRANFEYTLLEKYVCGVILQGTEIKSIRLGKVSLVDSYCYLKNDELWIKQMNIAQYNFGNIYNHEETRERKLLLKKTELKKLLKSKVKGLTIVPTKLFINSRGFAKLEIALAKGKKLYDKRQTIKERDIKKQNNKIINKNY